MSRASVITILVAGFVGLCSTHSQVAWAQQINKPFTVSDEIGLTLFDSAGGSPPELRFSPDRRYFAVWSECGRLRLNHVEDSLRFYRSEDIKKFIERSEESQPSPEWVVNRSNKEGRVITDWRWLADSSGVAFLEGQGEWGDKRLILADFRKKTIEPLTMASEQVEDFDIRDRRHYVYTVADRVQREKTQAEHNAPAMVGTGRSLYELLIPDHPVTIHEFSNRNNCLRAVVAGSVRSKGEWAANIDAGDLALHPMAKRCSPS